MQRILIKFKDFTQITEFVKLLNKEEGEFDLGCGRTVVDAKSILGILSLDHSRPLELYIYESNEDLLQKLNPYLYCNG